MRGAGLVADYVIDERPGEFRRQDRGILVDGAKAVETSVRSAEPQRLGLESAARRGRRQSARKGTEVEPRDLERRAPQVAVVTPEQEPMKAAGIVVLAGGDAGRPGRVLTVYWAGRAERD